MLKRKIINRVSLLPCPFCGDEAIIDRNSRDSWIEDPDSVDCVYVRCMRCDARSNPFIYGVDPMAYEDSERVVDGTFDECVKAAADSWNKRYVKEETKKGE